MPHVDQRDRKHKTRLFILAHTHISKVRKVIPPQASFEHRERRIVDFTTRMPHGLHPNSNGLQPNSEGLQPTSMHATYSIGPAHKPLPAAK